MKAPCKECADRCVGCHATCEKYISWKHEDEMQKEKLRKRDPAVSFAVASIKKRQREQQRHKRV